MTAFDLSSNMFEGPIPLEEVEISQGLFYLNLGENQLSGIIPHTIGNLSSLSVLLLHSNKLFGHIPSSICNITSLQYLHLSNNTLEGHIPPCLGNLSNSLQTLDLNTNHLSGHIPTTFSQLEGTLPESLLNCAQLEIMDIGNNQIQDKFPFWMEALTELRVLVLRSNKFHRTLLQDIQNANVRFPRLQVFDISRNDFSGSLPEWINFKGMMDVKENAMLARYSNMSYENSLKLFLKGEERSIDTLWVSFTIVDMSSNRFAGSIPKSVGGLNSLRYFNLSHNRLTGSIPMSFENMTALEALDLSSNKLEGEFPRQLTKLTFLAKLNLSMNNLIGQLPQSGGQFPTFDNDSYLGNSGLCGFPLTKKCDQDPNQQELDDDDDDDDSGFLDGLTWEVVLLGYGCGVVIGVAVCYIVLQYGRCYLV